MLEFRKYFVVLCATLYSAEARSVTFGYEPVPAAGGWLRLHSAPATWPDALLRCTLEGGVLASPSSRAIAAAMKSKLTMLQQKDYTTKVFIGIHAALTEEEFVSLDRVPFSNISLAWSRGEPDNKDNNEQCLVMTAAGELADENCSSVFRYFCFKQGPAPIEEPKHEFNHLCGTTDLDYNWCLETGHCYKFHSTQRTWKDAKEICQSEGAHLIVINSDKEALVLDDFFVEYPPSVTMNELNGDTILVGFSRSPDSQEFKTIFDETLPEAGFSRWAKGEPSGGLEYCGSVVRGTRLNDVPCTVRSTFVCEMVPHIRSKINNYV